MARVRANIVNFHILWTLLLGVVMFGFWYVQIGRLSDGSGLKISGIMYAVALCVLLFNLIYPLFCALAASKAANAKMYYPTLVRFIR